MIQKNATLSNVLPVLPLPLSLPELPLANHMKPSIHTSAYDPASDSDELDS